MTVASPPPRTPIPGGSPVPAAPDPAALIEEARQRARKRRRTGTALVVLLVLLGGAIFLGATGRLAETSGDSAGARPLTGAPEPGLIAYATGRGEHLCRLGERQRAAEAHHVPDGRAACLVRDRSVRVVT